MGLGLLSFQVHDLQKDVQGGARQEQVSSDWNVPSERVPIAEPAAEELEYCISSGFAASGLGFRV